MESRGNSWIYSCFAVWFCGLSSVPISLSQFYLSSIMSLRCDAPADILVIHVRTNEASVMHIKLLLHF